MLKQTKWLAVLLAAVLMLGSCAQVGGAVLAARVGMPAGAGEVAAQPETAPGLSASAAEAHPAGDEPAGEYREGTVLVKYDGEMTDHILDQLGLVSAERLWSGSEWYTVTIGETRNTRETVAYLRELGCFAQVDYDYIMKGDGEVASVDVSSNPEYTKQEGYLDTLGVGKAWNYIRSLGKHPGGSADVVVAVIDTGVDYSHPDLQNNIWINSGEIPGNGIDDDGNGYVDDVYGWNFVGGNNDPMDDNGHGTHVAGIVAMENNAVGGVGVAYNSKVMVLKAGNSSGYFNNSDIAEAIQYAYMNGASVINMSFGGSMISMAVEEALQMAYNSCVLVAAAGNDGLCNQPGCPGHFNARASYPAALPYVIGVMSCDATGTVESGFSNFDHYPYNSVEYEIYAPGEGICSTWPENRYATLNGTSMAAPAVSGIVALLRTVYADREKYSTKFIQSQLINTTEFCADALHALTDSPKPAVKLYDYRIDDSTDISQKNNGNGVMDAGETVRLYVSLQNRGGVASNVQVALDTLRMSGQSDPYFTLLKDRVALSDIGTYSVREAEGEQYFEIEIHADCPNDYLTDFNLHFTYANGMIATDETVFSGEGVVQFNVCNGIILPVVISSDMTLTADRLYIVQNPVYIPKDVVVTAEAGTTVQFDNIEKLEIEVDGTLICQGTAEKHVKFSGYKYTDGRTGTSYPYLAGGIEYNYTDFNGIGHVGGDWAEYCTFYDCKNVYVRKIQNSKIKGGSIYAHLKHCQIIVDNYGEYIHDGSMGSERFSDCVILANNISVSSNLGFRTACNLTSENIYKIITDGTKTYVVLFRDYFSLSYSEQLICMQIAELMDGRIAELDSNLEKILSSNGVTGGACFVNGSIKTFGKITDKNAPSTQGEKYVILEIDESNLTSDILLERYTLNFEKKTYLGILNVDNTAWLSANTTIQSYYNIKATDTRYRWDLSGIYLGTNDAKKIEAMMTDYRLYHEYMSLMPVNYLETANEKMWPMVSNAYILNKDGKRITTIGIEPVQFVVEFNRDMNTSIPLTVTFGTVAPYSDYKVEGEWITSRKWVGNYTLKSNIENGNQYLMVSNAQAAEDAFFTAEDRTGRFTFTIDTTAAMSMNLNAQPEETGILLKWNQDDYATLMGYNLYRCDTKNGNYVRINPSVLLASEESFLDTNAEPGKTYWYTFTVVLSDFSETAPAGRVSATALDTLAPSLYHTPVNQGYLGNNLVISCTASDNVSVSAVTLFFRAKGTTEWTARTMSRVNDKYSATVFGSELTADGLEYYILASDGRNNVAKGSEEAPYQVVVKDASLISRLGDVDGDGIISAKDALMILQHIGGEVLLTDDQFRRADLNSDGELSAVEALRILQFINGKVTSLAM